MRSVVKTDIGRFSTMHLRSWHNG